MTELAVIHFFFAVLASWRIAELFTQDQITAKLRERFPSYIWQCGRCMSVWSGIFATTAFMFAPWLNWPFALSWLYIAAFDARKTKRLSKRGRRLLVYVKSNGSYDVDSELAGDEIRLLLADIASRQSRFEETGVRRNI